MTSFGSLLDPGDHLHLPDDCKRGGGDGKTSVLPDSLTTDASGEIEHGRHSFRDHSLLAAQYLRRHLCEPNSLPGQRAEMGSLRGSYLSEHRCRDIINTGLHPMHRTVGFLGPQSGHGMRAGASINKILVFRWG